MALIPIAAAVLVAYGIITWTVNLRYHIKEARRSGLPYVVTREPRPPQIIPYSIQLLLSSFQGNR